MALWERLYATFPQWAYYVLVLCAFAVLFAGTIVVCHSFLLDSLSLLAGCLGMSHALAGVTLLAIGNDIPEIMNSIYGAREDPAIVITCAVGATLAITTVVQGAVFVAGRGVAIRKVTFAAGSAVVLAAHAILSLIVWYGRITMQMALALIGAYVLYIAVVVWLHPMKPAKVSTMVQNARAWTPSQLFFHSRTTLRSPGDPWCSATWGQRLLLIAKSATNWEDSHCILSAALAMHQLVLGLAIPKVVVIDRVADRVVQRIATVTSPAMVVPILLYQLGVPVPAPVGLIVALACPLPLAIILAFVGRAPGQSLHVIRVVYVLIASITMLALIAKVTVHTLVLNCSRLKIPATTASLVLLAWGTTLGDLAASCSASLRGAAMLETALAALCTIPLQTCLLVFGLTTLSHGGYLEWSKLGSGIPVLIASSAAAPVVAASSVALFGKATAPIGVVLILMYVVSVAVVLYMRVR